MKNEFIALSDGHKIPALGLGTWQLQGENCTKVVTAALEMGYLHIDTAETYENQSDIAPALKKFKNHREKLWITSKLWRGDYTKERVPIAVDKMLRDLNIDYLDLLLIHWPDKSVPIGESMEAMEKERLKGKIRSIGMSNATQRHIQDALDTGVKVVVNQVEYHPYLNQNELREWCQSKGVTITAYSPLAHGEVFKDKILTEIGKAYGKNAGQVACRWAYQKGMVVLCKTEHVERLAPNAQIFDFELNPTDMAKIEALNRNERQIKPDFQEFDYVF